MESNEATTATATPPSPDAPALIEYRGLVKHYGPVKALKGVDFEIRRGEVLGLLGDNGAGKSTLIKILSGIVTPTAGQLFADGQPARIRNRRDSYKLGIETIYQDIALVDQMDIMRNIFLGREITTRFGFLDMKAMREAAMEVLEKTVGISGIQSPSQKVKGLSGGQKQAVAIARAVYFKNKILLLDEPTSALSVRETEKTLEYILQLKREGLSTVLVTHNIYHGYQVADRFVVLSHGEKIMDVRKEETSIDELTELVVRVSS